MSNLFALQLTAVQPLAVASVQVEQAPLGTVAQPASQPSAALSLESNLLALHEYITVHPLARSESQVEQMPLVATHPASQPFVASLSVSNLLATQLTAVHPLAVASVQVEQTPLGTVAHPTSHPSAGLLLASKLFEKQYCKLVHPLAVAFLQALQ
jgi:hypothetical protein